MVVSIIGPQGSGKTTLANKLALKCSGGRKIYYCGFISSPFQYLKIQDLDSIKRDAVVIIDDANAFLMSYNLFEKNSPLRERIIMSRHYRLLLLFIFHSIDDAIKFVYRQSQFIYVSEKYPDIKTLKLQFKETVGKPGYRFYKARRY
ncbi:MAG: ATP-binding protein [Patescibacteria group bacterium]|nr:ATP-binding protein [Patescibacteria group bacterium]